MVGREVAKSTFHLAHRAAIGRMQHTFVRHRIPTNLRRITMAFCFCFGNRVGSNASVNARDDADDAVRDCVTAGDYSTALSCRTSTPATAGRVGGKCTVCLLQGHCKSWGASMSFGLRTCIPQDLLGKEDCPQRKSTVPRVAYMHSW